MMRAYTHGHAVQRATPKRWLSLSLLILILAALPLRAHAILDGFSIERSVYDEETGERTVTVSISGNEIRAVAVQPWDGMVVIGGDFTITSADPPIILTNLARIRTDGTLDTSFAPQPDGPVNAIVIRQDRSDPVQPGESRTYIGGSFENIGGETRNGLARLKSGDGAVDANFHPASMADTLINALALQPNGNLLVGGEFSEMAGGARNNIARISIPALTDAGLLAAGFPDGTNGAVQAILNQNGMIVIGGSFTEPRAYLARFSPGDLIDASFSAEPGAAVRALALQPDGKILLGGDFSSITTPLDPLAQPRNYLARLTSDGKLDTFDAALEPFDLLGEHFIATIALQSDGKILVGGRFTRAGPDPANPTHHVARLKPGGSLDDSIDLEPDDSVSAIVVQPDGKFLMAGKFTTAGGALRRALLARFYPNGMLDGDALPLDPSLLDDVLALSLQPDGSTSIAGWVPAAEPGKGTRVAKLNTDFSLNNSFGPQMDIDHEVKALALLPDGGLIAGGVFNAINGDTSKFITRLDASGNPDPVFMAHVNDIYAGIDGTVSLVQALALLPKGSRMSKQTGSLPKDTSLDPGMIYVAGRMIPLNPADPTLHLVRLKENGERELVADFNPLLDGMVRSLAIQSDDKIVIGGDFTGRIMRLETNGDKDESFKPAVPNGMVVSVAVDKEGRILVAGNFTQLVSPTDPPITFNHKWIARLHHDGTIDDTFKADEPVDSTGYGFGIEGFALQTDGQMVIHGFFDQVISNGEPQVRDLLARIGDTGKLQGASSLLPFDPYSRGINNVSVVNLQSDGKMLIAGDFIKAGEEGTISNVARLSNGWATQELSVSPGGSTITWMRAGTGPEVWGVTFEKSATPEVADSWTYLGRGESIDGGWKLGGQSFPISQNSYVRARGYVVGSGRSSSGTIIESVRLFYLKEPITVKAQPESRRYGEANPTTYTAQYLDAHDVPIVLPPASFSGTPSFETLATANSSAGDYGITADVANMSSLVYSFIPADGTLTISKAPLTITAQDESRSVGAPNPAFTPIYTGWVGVDTPTSLGGVPAFSTDADAASPAGKYAIVAGPGSLTSINYEFSFVDGVLTVEGGAAPQSITFNPMRPKTFGDADFDPGATASSHLDVEYASSATGIATVVGRKLRVLAPGTSEITASQAGNEQYEAAADVTRTLIVNPPPWNGLGFDGSDDVMQVAHAPQLNFGNLTDFTVETWLQLDGSQPDGTGLLSKGEGGVAWSGYQLILHQNRIAAEIGAGSASFGVTEGLIGTSNLNDGQWHHVALSVDRATATASLYLDGRLEARLSDPALAVNLDNATVLRLGVDRSGSRFFKGRIDETRLWNSARGKDEIRAAVSQIIDPLDESHLAAYYHFDEGDVGLNNAVFTTAPERTANGATGSLQGFDLSGAASNWIRSGAFLPLLETAPISLITSTGATSGGEVYPNYYPATGVGLCWGIAPNPGLTDSCSHSGGGGSPEIAWIPQASNGGGAFVGAMTGLQPGSTYHVRAFATNQMGTAYGNDITFQVARLDQTISFGLIANRTYGDAGFNAVGSATSGLPITYTSSDPAVAVVVNGQIRIIGAGSTVITASQAGNESYNPATDVSQPFTVNKKALSVTAENKSRAYLAANPALSVIYQEFVVGEDIAVISGAPDLSTAATPASPVGNYDIVVGLGTLAAQNYSFTPTNGTLSVSRAAQSISFGPISDRIYGDTVFEPGGRATSGLPITYTSSNPAVAVLVNGQIRITGAGSTIITASQGGNGLFEPALDVSQSFTVNQKTLSVTADNKSRAYLAANPVLTGNCQGFVAGEGLAVVSGSPNLWTAATPASPVGSYDIVVSLGTLEAANYSFTLTNGLLTVSRAAQSISFGPVADKIYGDAGFALLGSATSGLPVSYTSSNTAVATVVNGAVLIMGAGSTVITASQGGNEFYEPAIDVSHSLTVNKKVLIITADNKSRAYHTANPALTAECQGYIPGEDITFLSGAPELSTTATMPSTVGAYDIVVGLGTLTAANYSFALRNGILTVGAALQVINFEPMRAKTFGDGEFDPGATASSLLEVEYTRSAPGIATVAGRKIRVLAPGTTEITASQAGNEQYEPAADVTRTLIVNPPPWNGLGFDGSDDVMQVAHAPQLNFGNLTDFTIETWLQLDGSQPDGTGLLSKGEGGVAWSGYQLILHQNRIAAEIGAGNGSFGVTDGLVGTSNLNDGQWHHVALSVDRAAATASLYLDGRLEARLSDPALAVNLDNVDVLKLGVDRSGSRFFKGRIDETRLWNSVRSKDEIRAAVSRIIEPLDESHLAAYYHLDEGDVGQNNASFTTVPERTANGATGSLQGFDLSGTASNWIRSGAFLPLLETAPITTITSNGATSGGEVYPNYYPATEVGLCWGTSSNPGLTDSCSRSGGGQSAEVAWLPQALNGGGAFISAMAGLQPGSTYHVRAFATNQMGTAYGNDLTFQVARLDQTISFGLIANRTYGDAGFNAGGSATSGLPITYTSSNPAVAVLSNGQIRITGAGSTIITASQAGNESFNPAPDVSQSFTVNKKALSVTAENKSRAYLAANPALSVTFQGFVVGEDIAVISGAPDLSTAATPASPRGSYDIVVGLGTLEAANYSFTLTNGLLTVSRAAQSISFAPVADKIYGDAGFALVGSATSGLPVSYTSSNTAVATVVNGAVVIMGAGSTVITASQSGNGFYEPALDVSRSFTVNRKVITITADNKSRTYHTANPALTAVWQGYIQGEDVTFISGAPELFTTATMSSTVGAYDIVVGLGTLTADNYTFVLRNGILTVRAASQTITFDLMRAKTFGDGEFDTGATASSLLDVEYTSSAPGIATVVGRKIRVLAPGTTEIRASQAGNEQYEPAADVMRTLTVNPPPWHGLGFDGSDDVMQVADAPQLNFGDENGFSIETWLQLDGSQPNGTGLLSKGEGDGTWSGYQLILHQDRIAAEIGDGTVSFGVADGLIGTSSLNDGQWHQVALSVDRASATASLYLDGRLEAQLSNSAIGINPDNADDLKLGVDRSGSHFFKGRIDEVRLWNSVRSKDEIRAAVSQIIDPLDEPNLAAYYHFDEGDVGLNNAAFMTAPERTANGANGTLQGFALSGADSNWIRSGAFLPLLETAPITLITTNAATGGGTVYPNYYPPSDLGLCWGTTANPGLTDTCSHSGSSLSAGVASVPQASYGGGFFGAMTNLTPCVTYHVRAFATNLMGTAYGNNITFQVGRLNQTISFGPIDDRTYGDAGFNLSGSATSGLPISYTSSNPAVALVLNGQLRIVGVGSTVITASQAGNQAYNPAPDVSQSFTVNKKALAVSADNKSRAYQTLNPWLTASYQGFIPDEDISVITGAPYLSTVASPASPVGSYDIVVEPGTLAAQNYRFVFTKGTLTVFQSCQEIVFPPISDRTYGDAPFEITASSCSGLPVSFTSSDPQVAQISGNSVIIIGTGSVIITASQGGNGDLEIPPDVFRTLIVHKSGQALSFSSLPRKVLGDAPFSLAATASSGLSVSYLSSDPSVAEVNGSIVTIVGAGTAVISAIQEGDDNYNAALPASQPLTVSLEGTSPLVVLSTLATGAVTADPVLNVMGTASDASGIASLTMNGIDLTSKAELFSSAVPLAIGDNSVTVSAKDGAGNVTTQTLGIVLDATGPAIELLEPADNSVTNLPFFTASGTVAPGSAVTFNVNGGSTQTLPVVDGGFTGSGYLESGVNTIEFSTVLTGRGSSIKRSVIFASDKPFVAITEPGADIRTEKDTITIRGRAGAVGSAVSIKLDVDGSVFTPVITEGAFLQQIALDHAGQISIRASVTDSGGKVSVAQRNIIRIEKILGDLNLDGLVDIQDAAALLRISLGMDPATPQAFAHGDVAPLVNGVSQPDGKIDVGDVLVLLRKIVGLVDF